MASAPDYSLLDLSSFDDDGVVRNLGGCIAPEQLMAPTGARWARIATVKMRSVGRGFARLELSEVRSPFTGVSVVGSNTVVDPVNITYGQVDLRVLAPTSLSRRSRSR